MEINKKVVLGLGIYLTSSVGPSPGDKVPLRTTRTGTPTILITYHLQYTYLCSCGLPMESNPCNHRFLLRCSEANMFVE